MNNIDRSIGRFQINILKSAIFYLLLLLFAAIFLLSSPFFIFLIAIIVTYTILLREKILFEIFLIYTIWTGGSDWWSPTTEQVILGAMPLKSHLKALKNLQITDIITIQKAFETKNSLIYPLCMDSVNALKIKQYKFEAPDFIPLSTTLINQGADLIQKIITENRDAKIYVHCKAGRGRSAAIVLAYLLKYAEKFENIDDAYSFLKKQRPQVNLNQKQLNSVKEASKSW